MDQTVFAVETSAAYNSWPMCQFVASGLICAYSRGRGHNSTEPLRAVYARVSFDKGKSWEAERLVCNTPDRGDVPIGKGVDRHGNMLLWVRSAGADYRHALYRTNDGKGFECISTPEFPGDLIQVTDILHIPEIGMVSFFFGGSYGANARNYWGKLVSTDDGLTWEMSIIEDGLAIADWPTEPSAVYLGNGRILIIARTEYCESSDLHAQFQIISTDYGKTWKKSSTNIRDIFCSTPSLIYDPESKLIYNYYYWRGKGLLNRRIADAAYIFDNPQEWPEPAIVATGSSSLWDAGNVNSTVIGSEHFLSYYSGKAAETAIFVAMIPQTGL